MRVKRARSLVIASIAVWTWLIPATAQAPTDLEALMARIGERVASYYHRAQKVTCVERSTVQPIARNFSVEGFARTVESDLRVEAEAADGDALPDAKVIRDIRTINGRPPRERDKKDRSGCTDPNPLSPEPLAFLLPSRRGGYHFTSVRDAKEKNRAALVIEFTSADRTNRPVLIEDEGGHDDCFDWFGPVARKGRLWVDAETHDVLRVERRLEGPVDIRVPHALQRRHNLEAWVVLERDDQVLRYKAVAFTDPDEVIFLPESIESLTILRSSLQSIRRTDTFSLYRRFLTAGRIVK